MQIEQGGLGRDARAHVEAGGQLRTIAATELQGAHLDVGGRVGVEQARGVFKFRPRLGDAQLMHGLALARQAAEFGQFQERFQIAIQGHSGFLHIVG
ncbi:hypothetical protein D3C81_1179290 [compost metagenome]